MPRKKFKILLTGINVPCQNMPEKEYKELVEKSHVK